jgi:uncharacterized protein YoxC
MTIIEMCLFILTLVFVVLIIYIIQTLKTIQKTLTNLNNVINLTKPNIEKGGDEALRLLHHSNELIITANHHLNAFNPLFKSVSNMGEALQKATHSLTDEGIKASENNPKKLHREKLEELIQLVALGILFWQQIKKRR